MVQYGIVKTDVGAFGFVAREKRLLATYLPEAEPQIRRRIRKRWPDATENTRLLPRFRQKWRATTRASAPHSTRKRTFQTSRRFVVSCSNNAAKSPTGRPPATRTSPAPPGMPGLREPPGRPWPTTRCPLSCPAIVCFGLTGRSEDSPPRAGSGRKKECCRSRVRNWHRRAMDRRVPSRCTSGSEAPPCPERVETC